MNVRWVLPLVALAGAVAVHSCALEQATPFCTVGTGSFAARFELRSGTGPCAQLKGEVVGMNFFQARDGGTRQTMAIRSLTMTMLEQRSYVEGRPDPSAALNALGEFDTDYARADHFCTVPGLSVAELNLKATEELRVPLQADGGYGPDFTDLDGGVRLPRPDAYIDADGGDLVVPALQSASLKYEWSNLRSFVTPALLGNQVEAALKVTADGCEATYDAFAVTPAISCAGLDGGADESMCALPDPTSGAVLDPKYAVVCDPELLFCVIPGKVPQWQ